MSYALVIDDAIQATQGRLPSTARRLDTQATVCPLDGVWTQTLHEACGWFEVVDTPPTFDEATEVRERGTVELVDGTPTRQYTVRAKTAAELAAEADAADRAAKGINVANAVSTLRGWADQMEGVTVTQGNAVNVLQQFVERQAIFYDRFADLIESQRFDQAGNAP